MVEKVDRRIGSFLRDIGQGAREKRVQLDDPGLARMRLTPQMKDYDAFSDRGHTQYLPYLMFFNRPGFESAAIRTDELGFRFATDAHGEPLSLGTGVARNEVNLLVGASPALGYGATSDATSLASRLSANDPDGIPWLNLAGHCFNAAQELVLFALYADRLPKVRKIVVMSGFNTLVMARLPEFVRGGLPPFYFCGDFYERYDELAVAHGGPPPTRKLPRWPAEVTATPPIGETIERATRETVARLTAWTTLAAGMGARLTFLNQPLATWVRTPCPQEQELFGELDRISRLGTWETLYGDISRPDAGAAYASSLAKACQETGICFGDLVPDLRDAPADEWLYVDRAHFTDVGNQLVADAIQHKID